jgi:hypothetical protein
MARRQIQEADGLSTVWIGETDDADHVRRAGVGWIVVYSSGPGKIQTE